MSVLESALRTYLVEKPISAGSRIYPLVLPQTPTYPALTYQQITNSGHHDIPFDFPRIQITAWSDRLLEAKQLAEEVQSALQRYKGLMGGYKIKQIVKEPSPGDLFDREAGTDGVYYVPVDYKIIYER